MRDWSDGDMASKFTLYIGSKPRSAIAVILTLVVALVVVSASLAVALFYHPAKTPYPSQNSNGFLIKLVGGKVIYTQNSTGSIENETPGQSFPYSEMRILFRVSYTTNFKPSGYDQISSMDFGNQTLLNASHSATVHQVLVTSSAGNVSIDITDSAGDGSFDQGDIIVYNIVPLGEDIIYTTGLFWGSPEHHGAMATEFSFAVHDGKLYGWSSTYLNDVPWYEPYMTP